MLLFGTLAECHQGDVHHHQSSSPRHAALGLPLEVVQAVRSSVGRIGWGINAN